MVHSVGFELPREGERWPWWCIGPQREERKRHGLVVKTRNWMDKEMVELGNCDDVVLETYFFL